MNNIALALIIVASILLTLLVIAFISGTILIFLCNHHDHTYNKLVDSNNEQLNLAFKYSKDQDWFYKDNFFTYVSIKAFDKKKISAYMHNENSHLYIVFAHGYTGNPQEKAHCLHDLFDTYHCNIVSIEQRGQSNSKVKYLTMGYKEGKDLKSWTDYIVSFDKDAKIIVFGESMGAATVLTGLNFKYNKNVLGVIADSSYTSIHSQYMFSSRKMVPAFLAYFVVFGSIMAYFFIHKMRTVKYSPISAVKNKTIPICFIHGEDDSIVSYKSFLKFKKCINKQTYSVFESFPYTEHVAGYFVDTKRYLKVLCSFIDKFANENITIR